MFVTCSYLTIAVANSTRRLYDVSLSSTVVKEKGEDIVIISLIDVTCQENVIFDEAFLGWSPQAMVLLETINILDKIH